MMDLEKPLWQLSVGEFIKLLESQTPTAPTVEVEDRAPDYEYGIAGIAKIFRCSDSSAKRIKASGIIDGAIKQHGRLIVIDRKMALELFGSKK